MEPVQIQVPEGTPLIQKSLIGIEGNVFVVLGTVRKGLKKAGATSEQLDAFQTQATADDYDHLLMVAMAFTDPEAM